MGCSVTRSGVRKNEMAIDLIVMELIRRDLASSKPFFC